MQFKKQGRLMIIVVAATALAASFAGAAVASSLTHVTLTGRSVVFKVVQTENAPSSTSSTSFVTLAGTPVSFSVPSGASRLIETSFTAESRCTGRAGTWCSIRILITNTTTGATAELHPQAGIDFAFDSAGSSDDFWEAHAMERSIRVPAGNYRVEVQQATTTSSTVFRLDDWHFAVEALT